jgi:hypothetical protein
MFYNADDRMGHKQSFGWNRRLHGLSEELVISLYSNQGKVQSIIDRPAVQETTVPDGNTVNKDTINKRQIIISFSALQNLKKIFCTSVPKNELSYLHGIRFLRKGWKFIIN